MPASKDFRRYAEKWLHLFEWFEAHPDEAHTIRTESHAQARSLRFEFYKAREAMRADLGMKDDFPNTNRRAVFLTGDGKDVVFRTKDQTPIADLIARSLERAKSRDIR